MSFLEIATAMAMRGVHVVPTYTGLRHPANWPDLATTDLATISQWGDTYVGYNCCSVAKRESTGVLDIDDLEAAHSTDGTVFELMRSQGSWTFSTLYTFANACFPAPIAIDPAGNFYGTCYLGSLYNLS